MVAEIKYARHVDGEGNMKFVRLASVLNGSVIPYDAEQHHGSIICDECEAGVHYRSQKHSIGGSTLNHAAEHFALLPHNRHDISCRHINPEDRLENSLFNSHPDNGYRLHFNPDTDLTGNFNAHSIYYKDADRKTRARHSFLPEGETEKSFMSHAPLSLHSLGDFLDLMQKGDIERLKQSFVVTGTHVVPLNHYVVRTGRTTENYPNPKFRHLTECLLDGNISADGLPRIMEIEIKDPVRSDFFKDNYPVQGKAIFLDGNGNHKRFAIPKIYVETKGDYRLQSLFEKAGRYSVMGLVRPYTLDNGSVMLNMRLTDLAQFDERLSSEIFKTRIDEIDSARTQSPFPEAA